MIRDGWAKNPSVPKDSHVKRVSVQTSNPRNRGSISLAVILVLGLPLVNSGDISCQGIRYTYFNKGLDVSEIPNNPQQGIHLKICPRGVTCCTPEMETKLWTLARESYSSSLMSSTQHIQSTFHTKSRKFDEFFTELLAHSKQDFHFMFKKTYGILYERNSDVFTDFFKDLESYYDNGNVDLEEALRKFFSQLYQRMFTVLNSQYSFDSKYLECVSKNMKKLQPFGDVPKKLTLQLRRSFVATRTFSQALIEGKRVLTKILKISPKDKCTEALTKMTSCPACQGFPAIRPCSSYCLNVMKGCLAYHSELSDSWDKFVDNLIAVGERLIGPFNIEAVVEPIDIKISDAIMNFQESGYEVTQKVFQDCGQPRLGKRQSSSLGFKSKNYPIDRPVKPMTISGTNLDSLVNEIVTKLKETKGFWTQIPYILCQNPEVGSGKDNVEQNCWNGRERGTYQSKVIKDGLVAQEQNPEVEVDTTRPDVNINEQIFSLKIATNKLENAYNGHSVEWPHYEPKYPNDSGYYHGSGDKDVDDCFDDEDCFTNGSGSGDVNDSVTDGSGDDYDDNGDSGSPEPAWPPWVTGKTPFQERDFTIEEENPSTIQPSFSGGSSICHLKKDLIHNLLPLIVIQLGRIIWF